MSVPHWLPPQTILQMSSTGNPEFREFKPRAMDTNSQQCVLMVEKSRGGAHHQWIPCTWSNFVGLCFYFRDSLSLSLKIPFSLLFSSMRWNFQILILKSHSRPETQTRSERNSFYKNTVGGGRCGCGRDCLD